MESGPPHVGMGGGGSTVTTCTNGPEYVRKAVFDGQKVDELEVEDGVRDGGRARG